MGWTRGLGGPPLQSRSFRTLFAWSTHRSRGGSLCRLTLSDPMKPSAKSFRDSDRRISPISARMDVHEGRKMALIMHFFCPAELKKSRPCPDGAGRASPGIPGEAAPGPQRFSLPIRCLRGRGRPARPARPGSREVRNLETK